MAVVSSRILKFAIAVSLFFPLFFKLSGRIYHSRVPLLDSGGVLMDLPLPVSIIGCYLGILLLWRYRSARLPLFIISLTFILMICSTLIISRGNIVSERRKLLLIVQFILPLFALVLGQIFDQRDAGQDLFVKAILLVLILIVPSQLLYTWTQGHIILGHSVPFFSIYQSHQYVVLMMVSGFLIAFSCLWEDKFFRRVLYALSPIVGIYAVASFSLLSIFLMAAGLFIITIFRFFRTGDKSALLLFLVVLFVSITYFYYCMGTWAFNAKFRPNSDSHAFLPKNVADRFGDWKFYSNRIVTNSQTLLLGHKTPPERLVRTSAHNYYLDFIYNFGLIAITPLLFLIGYTVLQCCKARRDILKSNILIGLTGVVLYNLLVDNNFKVALRQPYPGIIVAFLWGILLNKLVSGYPVDTEQVNR